MKKIAVFAEGLGEQIFVRTLLQCLIPLDQLSFACYRLLGNSSQEVPYRYAAEQPQVYFEIYNVGNDEKVLTAILDRINWLLSRGFVKVIGLRDMYSDSYRKRASLIDNRTIQKYIDTTNSEIDKRHHSEYIHFHFSIMELEAWWLAMYDLFPKIDERLTIEFIRSRLGYNLATINPETEFFHPAQDLKEILALVGLDYDKHRGDVEGIVKWIDDADILHATENNRCGCFESFYNDLAAY